MQQHTVVKLIHGFLGLFCSFKCDTALLADLPEIVINVRDEFRCSMVDGFKACAKLLQVLAL